MAANRDEVDAVAATQSKGGDDVDHIESGPKDGMMAETARVLDPVAERKLAFKFDIRLLPVLAVMCRHP